jgi:hypothetical protein
MHGKRPGQTGLVVDLHGLCCASSSLDVCGICNGGGVALDALGTCCGTALDARGLCCSGVVDGCGICSGARAAVGCGVAGCSCDCPEHGAAMLRMLRPHAPPQPAVLQQSH